MAYTASEIKVLAYNREEKPDFDPNEKNLWIGLAYCYDCFREGYDKKECMDRANMYIEDFERSKLRESGVKAVGAA